MFPYYIVRFKLLAAAVVAAFHSCFHTTQYDLNNCRALCHSTYPFMFPYYIVRFKRHTAIVCYFQFQQFPYYIVRFKLWFNDQTTEHIIGFHTTQYDLNSRSLSEIIYPRSSFHTTQYDLNNKQDRKSNTSWKRFHTTQYDLNMLPGEIYTPIIISFHTTQYDLNEIYEIIDMLYELGFHTTQYDLNASLTFFFSFLFDVSILHSTI